MQLVQLVHLALLALPVPAELRALAAPQATLVLVAQLGRVERLALRAQLVLRALRVQRALLVQPVLLVPRAQPERPVPRVLLAAEALPARRVPEVRPARKQTTRSSLLFKIVTQRCVRH